MYQSATKLSQPHNRMMNIQPNTNNHSQVTEHLANEKAQTLESIDKDQVSTSQSDTKSVTPSLSDTTSLTISLCDTLIVSPSPSPSILKIPFILNIPINPPPLSNYNLLNLQLGLITNSIYQNQLIPPQPMFTYQFLTHQLTHTTNITPNNKKLIYIPREMIEFINLYCVESFHTHQQNDMGLLFSHIRESNGMQINDKQMRIHNTINGQVIISNIDLHFQDGNIIYLIGMSNDHTFKQSIPWKIITIMRAETIYKQFGITKDKLPKSSRIMKYFIDGLTVTPEYVSKNIISKTNFKKLCKKESKVKNQIKTTTVNISEHKLKYYCRKSWNNGKFLPVVVIKCERQWIEWKKFIRIFDNKINRNQQWIGISLRYYSSNKKWQIECMDYDAGRVYYQFRLVGDNHNYRYSYNDLKKLINTKLNIK